MMTKLINKKILFGILIILIPVILYLFVPNQKTDKKGQTPVPTLPESPSPTTEQNKLKILGSSLPKRNLGLYEGFVIEFSDTPSPSEFYYEVAPQTLVSLSLEGSNILIRPRPTWNPNTDYTVTIKKTTKDTYGNQLDKDYIFKFKTIAERGI